MPVVNPCKDLRRSGISVSPFDVKPGDVCADKDEKLKVSSLSLTSLLKDCAKKKDLYHGSRVHADIHKCGLLETSNYLGNTLVSMYAKCGALARAQQVLDELPVQDVVSWNALIAGYVQHGKGHGALHCLRRMQDVGLSPNATTYACTLKACGTMQEGYIGEDIHKEIANQGLLEKDSVLGNALVDMYVKCGVFVKAQKVLDGLPMRSAASWNALILAYAQKGQVEEALGCIELMQIEGVPPDVASWNALIIGFSQHGHGEEALSCFHHMRSQHISPNPITYACTLKACGMTQAAQMGKKIHDEIVSQGLLEDNIVLGNALVDMYAKCGALTKAHEVLDELPARNVISWNTLIAGYAEHGRGKEALGCLRQMRSEGLSPDATTYACILKACGITRETDVGKEIHDEIVSQGLLSKNVMVGNALVDMYAKCGLLKKAREVLDELPARNVVSWSAMILGYVQKGDGKEALECFQRMQSEHLSPDAITYSCILKACGIMQDAQMGRRIHDEIAGRGLLGKNVVLGNALLDMYTKCGELGKAQEVLDGLLVRDVVSWSSLIAGYAQRGQGEEAMDCYRGMRSEGLFPNAITYACTLKACSIMLDPEMGDQIHDEVVSQGLLEKDIVLGNTLVEMYAKCGVFTKAQKALDEIPVRDVVSWSALITGFAQQARGEEAMDCFERMCIEGLSPDVVCWSALIGGYAQQGLVKEALDCFEWMKREGTPPNGVTFVNVLNACSHAGLVDKGQMYFEDMTARYGVTPDKEHYTCMVDLFGRARHFDKAMGVIKKTPFSDYPPIWSALLGACRKWGEVKLGQLAFEHAVQLDGHNVAAYISMANIYAVAGMQEDAERIERMRVTNAAWKQHGRSCWVDASGAVHQFVAGDTKHPSKGCIHAMLEDLESRVSAHYPSNFSSPILTNPVEGQLCQHSEMLAIACAILNTPQDMDIRIMKNTAVCANVHLAISLLSKIEHNRRIMIKDAKYLHVFEDGKCSCGD